MGLCPWMPYCLVNRYSYAHAYGDGTTTALVKVSAYLFLVFFLQNLGQFVTHFEPDPCLFAVYNPVLK